MAFTPVTNVEHQNRIKKRLKEQEREKIVNQLYLDLKRKDFGVKCRISRKQRCLQEAREQRQQQQ